MAHIKKEIVAKLKEAFAIGADVSAACCYAEVNRATFYRWCEEDKELKEKCDTLRERPILKAYQTIAKDLDKVESAKWYLERRRKIEFSTKVISDTNLTVDTVYDDIAKEVDEIMDLKEQNKKLGIELNKVKNDKHRKASKNSVNTNGKKIQA